MTWRSLAYSKTSNQQCWGTYSSLARTLLFTASKEAYYYLNAPKKVFSDNITGTKMKITGCVENPDQDFVGALTGDDGPLAAGALPHMEAENGEGEKNLAEALHGSVVKGKKTPNKSKDKAEKRLKP